MFSLFSVVIVYLFVAGSISLDPEEINEDETFLNLTSQGLEEIPLVFEDYTKLEVLNLSHNDLREIKPDIFKKNIKLKTIDLTDNPNLKLPDDGPFFISYFLETLILADNGLKQIPKLAFKDIYHLKVLDLRGNPIEFEKSEYFKNADEPPEKILISKIDESSLEFVCENEKLVFEISDENKEVTCSTYQNKSAKQHPDSEAEIVQDEKLQLSNDVETHMEYQNVQSDDPQSNNETESNEDLNNNDDNNKNATDIINPDSVDEKDDEPEVDESSEKTNNTGSQTNENQKSIEKSSEGNSTEEMDQSKEQSHNASESLNEQLNGTSEEEIVGKLSVGDDSKLNSEEISDENNATSIIEESNVNETLVKAFKNKNHEVIVNNTSEEEELNNREASNDRIIPVDPKLDVKRINTQQAAGNKQDHREEMDTSLKVNENVHEAIETIAEDAIQDEPKEGSSTEMNKSSSNIVLALVIVVLIGGTVAVGYKCVKDRRSGNARPNKEDPEEGKELKEIKVDRSNKQGEINEHEEEKKPLMTKPENTKNEENVNNGDLENTLEKSTKLKSDESTLKSDESNRENENPEVDQENVFREKHNSTPVPRALSNNNYDGFD